MALSLMALLTVSISSVMCRRMDTFLETLTGIRLMVDSARAADADFIVVDTTGYVHDPPRSHSQTAEN